MKDKLQRTLVGYIEQYPSYQIVGSADNKIGYLSEVLINHATAQIVLYFGEATSEETLEE